MTQIKDKAGWVEYYTDNYVSQKQGYGISCDIEFVKEQFNEQFQQKPVHTLKDDGTYIVGYEYDIKPERP